MAWKKGSSAKLFVLWRTKSEQWVQVNWQIYWMPLLRLHVVAQQVCIKSNSALITFCILCSYKSHQCELQECGLISKNSLEIVKWKTTPKTKQLYVKSLFYRLGQCFFMVSHRVIKIKRKAQTHNTHLEWEGRLSNASCMLQEWDVGGKRWREISPIENICCHWG